MQLLFDIEIRLLFAAIAKQDEAALDACVWTSGRIH
jgi:hypothetical protein